MSRLTDDLRSAARIGAHAGAGISRLAWSYDLIEAHEWLAERMRAAGLEVEHDPAGNVIGRWQSGQGKAIVLGSHLDTVPRAGAFDGALGVLAGLEAIRLLRESGIEPRRPVWLVSFADEEGARFGAGLFGSRAFSGEDVSGLGERRDARGMSLAEAMEAAGFDLAAARGARAIERVAAYLELHIEQGPTLEASGVDLGIVTGIVGVRQYLVRLVGRANHAGTTPMDGRRDALAGAARLVLALREEALAREGMTANVGRLRVEPGAVNVIPGVAELTVDVRAPTPEGFAEADRFVRETLALVAATEGLELELEETQRSDPVALFAELGATLERAAEAEGATHLRLPSGAGHDAMVLARYVPAAMLFVPSVGGVSHAPEELTEERYCELGARVLARAVAELVAG